MESQMKNTPSVSNLQLTPIAAALIFALYTGAANAAPVAGALPSGFSTNNAGVTYNSNGNNSATIVVPTSANTVLQWGGTNLPNAVAAPAGITSTAGFNIGAGSTLLIANQTTSGYGSNVLVSDLTGQASQIYGTLNTANSIDLTIANPNGIIIGGTGNVSVPGGYGTTLTLLGYASNTFTNNAPTYNSASPTRYGDLIVEQGSSVNANTVVLTGASNINVNGNITSNYVTLANGFGTTSGAINIGGTLNALNQITANALNGSINVTGTINAIPTSQYGLSTVYLQADNQILVSGAINASIINLTTNNQWSAPYNLGVVLFSTGSLAASNQINVNVAASAGNTGNMLQYGSIAITTPDSYQNGFNYSGNSYYQGSGAKINTSSAGFIYGNSPTGLGVLTGGIVQNSANPQPSSAFYNAVAIGGSNAPNGVSIQLQPVNMGTQIQNANILGIGNVSFNYTPYGYFQTIYGSNSTTSYSSNFANISNSFIPSNLYLRSQGGSINLGSVYYGGFYWPGLIYMSTVKAGTLATVDTSQVISTYSGTDPLSNALPYATTSGGGMYLLTGQVRSGSITVNANAGLHLTTLSSLMSQSLFTVGNVSPTSVTYNGVLPSTNIVTFTPPGI